MNNKAYTPAFSFSVSPLCPTDHIATALPMPSLWLPVVSPCDFFFCRTMPSHSPFLVAPQGTLHMVATTGLWLLIKHSRRFPFYCFLVGHFLCCPTPYLADTEDWKYPPLHGPHYSVIKVYIYLKQLLLFDLLAKTSIAQQSNCPFNHCSCPRLWDP